MDVSLGVRQERHLMRQRGAGARPIQGNFGFVFKAGPIQLPTPPASQRQPSPAADSLIPTVENVATSKPVVEKPGLAVQIDTGATYIGEGVPEDATARIPKQKEGGEAEPGPVASKVPSKSKAPRKRKALFTKKRPPASRTTEDTSSYIKDIINPKPVEVGVIAEGNQSTTQDGFDEGDDDELSFDKDPVPAQPKKSVAVMKRAAQGANDKAERHAAKRRKIDLSVDLVQEAEKERMPAPRLRKTKSAAKEMATDSAFEKARGKAALKEKVENLATDGDNAGHTLSPRKTAARGRKTGRNPAEFPSPTPDTIKDGSVLPVNAADFDRKSVAPRKRTARAESISEPGPKPEVEDFDKAETAAPRKKLRAVVSDKSMEIQASMKHNHVAANTQYDTKKVMESVPSFDMSVATQEKPARRANMAVPAAADVAAPDAIGEDVALPTKKGRAKKALQVSLPPADVREHIEEPLNNAAPIKKPATKVRRAKKIADDSATHAGDQEFHDGPGECAVANVEKPARRAGVVKNVSEQVDLKVDTDQDLPAKVSLGSAGAEEKSISRPPKPADKSRRVRKPKVGIVTSEVAADGRFMPAEVPAVKIRKAKRAAVAVDEPADTQGSEPLQPTTKRKRVALIEQDINSSSPQKLVSTAKDRLAIVDDEEVWYKTKKSKRTKISEPMSKHSEIPDKVPTGCPATTSTGHDAVPSTNSDPKPTARKRNPGTTASRKAKAGATGVVQLTSEEEFQSRNAPSVLASSSQNRNSTVKKALDAKMDDDALFAPITASTRSASMRSTSASASTSTKASFSAAKKPTDSARHIEASKPPLTSVRWKKKKIEVEEADVDLSDVFDGIAAIAAASSRRCVR